MAFFNITDTGIEIGGQFLTHEQLSKQFQKYREIGILELLAETHLSITNNKAINVQITPLLENPKRGILN